MSTLLNKYLNELKCAWKHYSKRAGRAFEEPQPGHEESWVYKTFRNSPWISRGSRISFFSAIFATVVLVSLFWVKSSESFNLVAQNVKFSQFEGIYVLIEYIFQVCVLPSMIYLIFILFFAHVIALIFKRVFDYPGYSAKWIAKRYIKFLGDATVGAIICGIVSFALFVSGENYKASFSLVDYISFFTFTFSVLYSFVVFIKIFVEMRKFFKYSIMGLIFPAGCIASSWIFFDVILNGSMLNSVAKAVTGSYIDPLLMRVQKLFDASPSDIATIRQNLSDNPLLWMGSSSLEYSVFLWYMKLTLLMTAISLFVFFWVHDTKKSTEKS